MQLLIVFGNFLKTTRTYTVIYVPYDRPEKRVFLSLQRQRAYTDPKRQPHTFLTKIAFGAELLPISNVESIFMFLVYQSFILILAIQKILAIKGKGFRNKDHV